VSSWVEARWEVNETRPERQQGVLCIYLKTLLIFMQTILMRFKYPGIISCILCWIFVLYEYRVFCISGIVANFFLIIMKKRDPTWFVKLWNHATIHRTIIDILVLNIIKHLSQRFCLQMLEFLKFEVPLYL
jgi:hypothetical protein